MKPIMRWSGLLLLVATTLASGCASLPPPRAKVRYGIEVFCAQGPRDDLKGAKAGLLTNHTGIDSQFNRTIDHLVERTDIQLVRLFAPEHGIQGEKFGDRHEDYAVDRKTGLPVYNLHGRAARERLAERLDGLDVVFYDIQDVGSRSYTRISVMLLVMQRCAEKGIKFIVLDRPNPLGGNRVEGNILESGKGYFEATPEVPYIYGLTPGELARWANHERRLSADLEVVELEGWRRDMEWRDTGLVWIPTSPHMPRAELCNYLTVTGILGELHAVNEGVGTPAPFEILGAPWIDSERLADALNEKKVPGFFFRPAAFVPRYHVYAGETCHGVQIHILDPTRIDTFFAGLVIMTTLQELYPEKRIFEGAFAPGRLGMFHTVCGTEQMRLDILAGRSAQQIDAEYARQRQAWVRRAAPHILYRIGNKTFTPE